MMILSIANRLYMNWCQFRTLFGLLLVSDRVNIRTQAPDHQRSQRHDDAGNDQHQIVRTGFFKDDADQERAALRTDIEDACQQSVERAEESKSEIAADQEGHEVQFAADAQPDQKRGDEGQTETESAAKRQDAEERNEQKQNRHIRGEHSIQQ